MRDRAQRQQHPVDMTSRSEEDWSRFVRGALYDMPNSGFAFPEALSEPLTLYSIEVPLLPPLPDRTPRATLSPYWIAKSADGSKVHVPWSAIYRDHREALKPPNNVCLGCVNGRHCAHGWEAPHPRDVIVIGARDPNGIIQFGWYGRFIAPANRLVRLPIAIVEQVQRRMEKDEGMCSSSLNTGYTDCYYTNPTLDFEVIALLRYERMKQQLHRVLREERKRKPRTQCGGAGRSTRAKVSFESAINLCSSASESGSAPPTPDNDPVARGSGQCIICLEEGEIVESSCCGSQGACCDGCRAKLRGYCPICERRDVNAQYACVMCQETVPLPEYGFPCLTCNRRVLCTCCYSTFAECDECDVLHPGGL